MNEYKTIKVKETIWKKLSFLKLELGVKTINDVIAKLIDDKQKENKE